MKKEFLVNRGEPCSKHKYKGLVCEPKGALDTNGEWWAKSIQDGYMETYSQGLECELTHSLHMGDIPCMTGDPRRRMTAFREYEA